MIKLSWLTQRGRWKTIGYAQDHEIEAWVLGLATAAGGAVDRSSEPTVPWAGGRSEVSLEEAAPVPAPSPDPKWTVLCDRCLRSVSRVDWSDGA